MTVTSYTNIQAMIPNEITALKINRLMDMHACSQGIYSIAITPHGIIYEKCTIPYRPLYMLTMAYFDNDRTTVLCYDSLHMHAYVSYSCQLGGLNKYLLDQHSQQATITITIYSLSHFLGTWE